jgi:hypothetical protein
MAADSHARREPAVFADRHVSVKLPAGPEPNLAAARSLTGI